MNLRERWEEQKPIARIGFFGQRGPEQSDVYDLQVTAPNMFSVALSRRGHLASVAFTAARLIYLVDTNPRQARGHEADARVFLDPELSIDVVTNTMSLSLISSDVYQAMADFMGDRVRALIGAASIQEISHLKDDGDFAFITFAGDDAPELWPELRHKR